MYEESYHSKVHKNLLEDKKYYLFRAKCADKFYWKYLKGRVIDFGCGLGQNIFLRKENAVGIDVSDFALKECEKRGIKVQKSISKIKKESVDGVLCVHVLEHMKNPYESIEEFYRILKKGGRVVIVLPLSKNYKPVRKFKSDIAKHFYNWNFSSMNEILGEIGFKIILNKFNYASGYSKVYKYPFELALFAMNLIGKIRNRKEMIIVAEK